MGAALLLVRHLIWCAYQIRCFAGARADPLGTSRDLMRSVGAGLVPTGAAKAHGRTRLARRIWSRGGLLGAAPGKCLPGLSGLPPSSHLVPRPLLPLCPPWPPHRLLAGFALKGAYSSRFCKRGSLNASLRKRLNCCVIANCRKGPKHDIAPVNMSGTNVWIDNDHNQA
jgi:hypothetical protein